MRKAIIGIVIFAFSAVIVFLIVKGNHFFAHNNLPNTNKAIEDAAYYKLHQIKINQVFIVDTVAYTITNFNYFEKNDSTILLVDIYIENKTNHAKHYIDRFFILKNDEEKIFYPNQYPFTIFENKTQYIKLIYTLPQKKLPYLKYSLHINSLFNSNQNGLISLFKNYRAAG